MYGGWEPIGRNGVKLISMGSRNKEVFDAMVSRKRINNTKMKGSTITFHFIRKQDLCDTCSIYKTKEKKKIE